MAAPVPESRACACSTPRRRAGRHPCVLPSPALPLPGPMLRKWSRVTGAHAKEDAPGRAGEASRYRLRWMACRHNGGSTAGTGFRRGIGGGGGAERTVTNVSHAQTLVLLSCSTPRAAGQRSGYPDDDRRCEDRKLDRRHRPHQSLRYPSILFVEQRLVGFVSQLGRGFGYFGAQFSQHGFRSPSQVKVCTGNACGPAAERRQYKASHLVD